MEVFGGATLIDTLSTAVAHNVTAEEFDRMPKARSFPGRGPDLPIGELGAESRVASR